VLPRYGNLARKSLIEGIERIAKTAALTLGPGGRNIALEYEGGDPKITKDGVTVVKSIFE
jgi:chaperonin GroEL